MFEKEDDWRKPFINFILDQRVPDDKAGENVLHSEALTTS
jgi:hypothetical protein